MTEQKPITSPEAPDLSALRAYLEEMIKSLRFAEMVLAIIALVTRMRELNAELMKHLAGLRRGRPRSETLKRVQRQFRLPFAKEDIQANKTMTQAEPGTPQTPSEQATNPEPNAETPQPEAKPKKSRKGRHPGRRPFPPHLERVPVLNPVPPELRVCPKCGTDDMKTVAHSVCEILHVIPARVVVLQRMDERIACPHDDAIVSAPTPPQIVERGIFSNTFLIEALADKYLEQMPIERQCLRWLRAGVDLAPQTLGHGVAVTIDLLKPLAREIATMTRSPGLLATDASAIPVLDRDAEEGIRTGTMWCWINSSWVTFVYSPDGKADGVRNFLGENLKRDVQCDGTNTTSFIERAGGRRPGCMSHGRRRLVEAARSGDQLAHEALEIIAGLFAVEKAARLAGDTHEQRLERRRQHSRPIMDKLRSWVDQQRAVIAPKSTMGRAVGYLHRQWRRLSLFLEDGRIELTNNRVERELRKLVLGRKNWLFTWEDLGGERTADILTIVGTCVAHGVNPRAYLHCVTNLILDGWRQAEIRELLPDRLITRHPELLVRTNHEHRLSESEETVALPAPEP